MKPRQFFPEAVRAVSLCLALLLLTTCLPLTSCTHRMKRYTADSFDFFDTVTTIVGYARSAEEFDRIIQRILREEAEFHRLFSIYESFDGIVNLSDINETGDNDGSGKVAHRKQTVSPELTEFLLYAKRMYDETNGRVNIAMGSVLSLWHECRENGQADPDSAILPSPDALREAQRHTNIEDVQIDPTADTVFLADPAMSLDVGALAKGYAAEKIAAGLEADGISGYLINIGGNVRSVGRRGDGQEWTVGIENPDRTDTDDPFIGLVHLDGQALVTSGSYQRFYTVDGKRYHHIIDPETAYPADIFLSVSVIAPDSALADALSTALFLMDVETGRALVESIDGVEALFVCPDGRQIRSSGFSSFSAD